ncbi:MAG: TonB-dependent receptor [Gemmatimonadaceae bacterium]
MGFTAGSFLPLAAPPRAQATSPPGTDTARLARVEGSVADSATGRALAQAEVTLRGTTRRALTDLSGFFTLRPVPAGTYVLEIRRLGYLPLSTPAFPVAEGEVVRLDLVLRATAFRLAEVTVVPGSFSLLEAGATARQTLSRASIETAPFGEDLFRALTRLPGLSSGDYGAHFSIRGGRHDETLILLDGLEIYEPFHLKDFNEGALSIIDVESIDGVELLTGGFPARYGDKRSGVMNISSRTPRGDGTHVTLGASLTNLQALAEGTFAGKRGSWLMSGRRGFADLLLGLINKNETKAPSYGDFFGTARYALHPRHALAFNVLHAQDRYQFGIKSTTGFNDTIPTRESADNRYGNSYAWLTLRSLAGEHLAIRTLASAGIVTATRMGNEHQLNLPIELYGVTGHRDFTVFGLKQDFTYQRAARMVLDWGYDLRSMRATFDWTNHVTQNPDDPAPDTTGYYPRITRREKRANGTTLGAYISDRIQLLDPLTLEAGVRYDGATYTHDRDWSPRVHALLNLPGSNTLRGGWGHYRQRQGIADENAFDRLNRYFPSELSAQWTVGFEHAYASGGSLRAEAYHKRGSHLRPILRNWKGGLNVFPESAEDRILVYPDVSTSRGIELYHDRRLGARMHVQAGYALSVVEEHVTRIDQVNDPLKPPFRATHPWPQDQRHAVNMNVSYRPATKWTINGAFVYHSGWPFTNEIGVPVRRRNGTTDLAIRPDSLYGARLPPYQRLDIRFTRRRQSANGEFRFFFELINLTNHENVLGYDVFRVRDATGMYRLVREAESWFTILPSLGVSWSRRF